MRCARATSTRRSTGRSRRSLGRFVDDYVDDRIPLRRVGTEADIAAAYAFLASDDAAFIPGSALAIDGGQTSVM